MNHCALIGEDKLKIRARHNGVHITGRFVFLEYNVFQIEITEPFSGIKDGCFTDLPQISEKYWYYKDDRITKLCLKEAKRLLIELYQVASFFDREQKAIQRVLLDAIEKGNESYAHYMSHPDHTPVEGYAIDRKGNVRTIPHEELAQHVDPRSPEEQRDFYILCSILFSALFINNNVFANWANLSHLINKHFGIKLIHSDKLRKFISRRLKSNQQKSKAE